jgi:hypothetical protein
MRLDRHDIQHLLDALIEARLGGIREVVDQNGEKITYKSDTEMSAAIAFAQKQIAAFNQATPKTIVFSTHKGLS